jgi:hypothetical protein
VEAEREPLRLFVIGRDSVIFLRHMVEVGH